MPWTAKENSKKSFQKKPLHKGIAQDYSNFSALPIFLGKKLQWQQRC